ncbi:MAG: squalene/phytoene synthase family protein [Deltaproteobacteria bacterium]|nr:squalene/phytoene synthase family protein [Deltaproteobacteria bacterium]
MKNISQWIKANEETLLKQSRSFAIPILNLDDRFRLPIMVEYNLNKTIDTIEDSPGIEYDEKIALIREFCEYLDKNEVSGNVRKRMLDATAHDEAYVFKNYEHMINLFNCLQDEETALMKKWTNKMAEGMCIFLKRPIYTQDDLNQYCYYVAGTVGIFLTNILKLKGSNITKENFRILEGSAVYFGLFLQKLNIIRDYIEDRDVKKRCFWPQKYLETEKDQIDVLNRLCDETSKNDVPRAIDYYCHIPPGNDSYDYFIRFILSSGLEYLKILKNNKSVFSRIKVKLPAVFIKTLFKKVSSQSRVEFRDYCNRFLAEP